MRTDTAHTAWNTRWGTPAGRSGWLEPEPEVIAVAQALHETGASAALDLGCGVGRHALLFARTGFAVTAVDLAEAGPAELARRAAEEGLAVRTEIAPMTDLSFADAVFDLVLAWNVVYHGDGQIVRRTFDGIARVLKPGALFQATMLSKRNAGYGKGREVAPDTFTRDPDPGDPDDADKAHPHFYCNAAELVALLEGFELKTLVDREQKKPGGWHWRFTAEKHA